MSEKLKPCPFCEKTDPVEVLLHSQIEVLADLDDGDYFAVCCNAQTGGCGAVGGYSETKEEAIEKWNRRATLCTLVQPEDIRCGKYFIRNDSWRMNAVYFVDVSPSGKLIVFSRSDKPGTVEDYVSRGYTFFRIPQVPQLEVAECWGK